MNKRIYALLAAVLMTMAVTVGILPLSVFAETEKQILTEQRLIMTPDGGLVQPEVISTRTIKSGAKGGTKSGVKSGAPAKDGSDSKDGSIPPQIVLEGALPTDITAEAVSVDPMDYIRPTESTILCAYDISLYCAEKEYEPEDTAISVSVSNDMIAEAEHPVVVHIQDDPAAPLELIEDYTLSGRTITFSTEHFSVFMIVDVGENGTDDILVTPRVYYYFLSPGTEGTGGEYTSTLYPIETDEQDTPGRNPVWMQIVKNGDSLNEVPIPPAQSGKSFLGWYYVWLSEDQEPPPEQPTGTETFTYAWPDSASLQRAEFGRPLSVVEEEDGACYYLAPLYRNYRILVFHEYDGSVITRKLVVLGTDEGELQGTVLISDVKAKNLDDTRTFYMWKIQERTQEQQLKVIDEQGNFKDTYYTVKPTNFDEGKIEIDVIPEFMDSHWVNFNTVDSRASFLKPALIQKNNGKVLITTALLSQKIPTLANHTFEGWYLDSGYNTQLCDGTGTMVPEYANGYEIHQDTMIYAKWAYNGDPVPYRYLFWQQLPTDSPGMADSQKHYSFLRSETKTGVAGAGHFTEEPTVPAIAGFTFRKDAPQEILEDGTTVVNIYYDREPRTIRFYTHDQYTESTASNATYGFVNGMYVPLTKGQTRYNVMTSHTYTQLITGTQGATYNNLYHISNQTYESYDYNVRYNNGKFQYRRYNFGNWRDVNEPLFTRSAGSDYSGTVYTRSGSNYSPTEAYSDSGTYYGYDSNGYYVLLDITAYTVNTDTWYDPDGNEYTGTRYTKTTSNYNWYLYTEFNGLYGQTFKEADVTWPTDYTWHEGSSTGKTITFLDAFLEQNEVLELYGDTASTSGATIRFWKQDLSMEADDFTIANTVRANVGYNGANFELTNKYEGFTLYQYRTNNGNWQNASVGGNVTIYNSTTLDIRFKRNTYDILFLDKNDDPDHPYVKIDNVPFGADLSQYASQALPPNESGLTYTGWRFNFEDATMPAYDLAIYADREMAKYNVTLDLDGGSFPWSFYSNTAQHDDPDWEWTYSTYFKVDAPPYRIEPYDIVERKYKPDPNGQFVYIYVTRSSPHNDPGTGEEMPRLALYVDKNSEFARRYADSLVKDDDGNIQYYTQMQWADGEYKLEGWYEVDPDTGELKPEPFNFMRTIDHDVTLRAVWINLGAKFKVMYHTMQTVDGVDVSGTLNNPAHYGAVTVENLLEKADYSLLGAPDNITPGYVFEYWLVGNTRYGPGDTFKILSNLADSEQTIHIQAVYAPKAQSVHNQKLTNLWLHRNDGTDPEPETDITKLNFLQVNEMVDLGQYSPSFRREGYELLGWARTPDAVVPDFSTIDKVGADLNDIDGKTNHLYAVWKAYPAPTMYQDNAVPYGILVIAVSAAVVLMILVRRRKGVVVHDDAPL